MKASSQSGILPSPTSRETLALSTNSFQEDSELHDETTVLEVSKHFRISSDEISDSKHETEASIDTFMDSPLPLFLKFVDVKFQVVCTPPRSWNARKALAKVRYGQNNQKKILNGISGSVVPGEILAMMGPSGSGKTSLLKILGGRLHGGVGGTVTYNDTRYHSALKRRIGFVAQDDLLFPQLTVRETLVFTALLRLPRSMTQKQKVLRAEKVIKELGLESCQNTRVGGMFVPGISGGERKRTSIGSEILVDPSLLLLDEPTSGLDSSTALKLLHVLQKNAKAGRTIVTTIHQPSSRLFHMFDKLVLISAGHPIYSGQAKDATKYFASLQFVPEIAMNPADFLLDLATGITRDITVPDQLVKLVDPVILVKNTGNLNDGQQNEVQWSTKYNGKLLPLDKSSLRARDVPQVNVDSSTSRQYNDHEFSSEVVKFLQMKYKTELESQERIRMERLGKVSEDLLAAIQVRRKWTSSWGTQFLVLSKRTLRERARDYFDNLRFFQSVGVSFLLGLLWWKSNIETESQLRDQVGLLFYICIFWSTSSIYSAVYIFPLEQDYLAKERAADMYRLSAYHVSSTLCDVPSQLLYPTIFMCILYFMAGFRRTAEAFLLTQLAVHLIVITGQGVGEFFGASILSIKRAGTVASLVLLVFLLTGGYYVQHIPGFIKWLKYTSFVYYGFRLLLKVQYSPHQIYECSSKAGCKTLQESPSFSGIKLEGGAEETWVLLIMAITYRLLAYICLRRIKINT